MKKVKGQKLKVKYAWKMLNVFVPVVIAGILLSVSFQVSYAQGRVENVEVYGVEGAAGEKDKGRSFLECLKGWRQFIAATSPFDPGNFDEYIKEIFYVSWRSPAHFADIVNIEEQVNRARYAVMAAFLRCDLNRLQSVTEAYYRLEAELYYVRHAVDTSGGYVQKREDFANELADYLIVLKAAAKPEEERAIYTGYFDLFASKYRERVKIYADSSNDPIFAELGAKWDELMETFKSFNSLGSETVSLMGDVGEAVVEGVSAVGDTLAAPFDNPGKALKDLASNIDERFKICPSTGHPDECITFTEALITGGSIVGKTAYEVGVVIKDIVVGSAKTAVGTGKAVKDKVVELFSSAAKSGAKITPQDVQKAADEVAAVVGKENVDKADMLLRYELLYGQVGGEGVLALMDRMDKLLGILGKDGSLPILKTAGQCAKTTKDKVCK